MICNHCSNSDPELWEEFYLEKPWNNCPMGEGWIKTLSICSCQRCGNLQSNIVSGREEE